MERKFLIEQAISLGLYAVSLTQPQTASADYFNDGVYGPTQTIQVDRPLLDTPIAPELLEKYNDLLRLEDYLESIIENRGNILYGIKNITKERMLDEFKRYFPMYKAGEIEYGVPWSLLMIIHAHETTFSSDPLTYNNLHVGGMQRAKSSWPERQIFEASENWEFLATLLQRYPNDFREILWAAKYIKSQAEIRYSYLSVEDGYLAVLRNNYSAPSNAILRVNKYTEFKLLKVTA